MSRGLALLATVAVACSSHGPAPAPVKPDGFAPARDTTPPPDAQVVRHVPDAPAAPPLPLDQDLPRLAARVVQLLQAVTSALEAAGDDCGVATQSLAHLQPRYADVFEAHAKVVSTNRKAELSAAFAAQQRALDTAGASVFHTRAATKCTGEPAFAAAFDHVLGAR